MVLKATGNLGIGTTGPNDILHVSKAGAATRLRVGNNGAHDASIYFNTSTDWSIGTDTSNSNALTFGNSSAIGTGTKVVIETGGDVGIGRTDPNARLDIKGAGGSTGLTFETSDASNNQTFFIQDGGRTGVRYFPFSIGIPSSTAVATNAAFQVEEAGLLTVLTSGNVGIGTTGPTYKLQVQGTGYFNDTLYVNGQTTINANLAVDEGIIGNSKNFATREAWVTGTGTKTGWFGGDFGSNAEGNVKYEIGPFGSRELIMETVPDTGNDYDGGWNKQITNLDINKIHMSIVYVKRIGSTTSGNFYHGTGASTNQILNISNNSSNTNPYFVATNIGTLPQDVWCVSIGFIQANNDSETSPSYASGGIYRLDTGQKVAGATHYKFGSAGATLGTGHRTFLYYSTDNASKLQFARPGFFECNGDEPTFQELVGRPTALLINSSGTPTLAANVTAAEIRSVIGAGTSDAGTLDGIDSSQFLRSDADDTATGKLTITTGTAWGTNLHLTNTNNDESPPILTFLKSQTSGYTAVADNDYVGFTNYRMKNDANEIHSWIEVSGIATDVSNGSESSLYRIGTWREGTEYSNTLTAQGGRVGINKANPGATLDVNGTIRLGQYNTLTWGSSTSNQLLIQNYLSGAGIVQSGGGNLEIQANTNDIVLKPAANERLRVHNGGNSGGIIIKGGSANWNETTPGTGEGAIHLDPENSSDNFGSAITFGASDASGGATGMAGIYTRSDGSYGTKMYFATTDSYATGAKTAMKIDSAGKVTLTRNCIHALSSKSFLHSAHFDGIINGASSGCAEIGRNHAYDTVELKGYGAEFMIGAQSTDLHINYRTCNSNISSNTPVNWFWRAGSSTSFSNHSMGTINASVSVKAPVFKDSANTAMYGDFGNTSTSLSTAGKWVCQGSHTSARLQLNYAHGSDVTNSGTLTGWTSEPGITYESSGIGGNIHVNGQYYGRAYNDGYGVYVRFDKGSGALQHWSTQGAPGTSGGQGTLQWYNDASGNSYSTTSARAPIFYDSNDTTYYVNPGVTSSNSTSHSAKFRQSVQIGDSSTYNQNDGGWGGRLIVSDNVHARIDVAQDANSMRSSWYSHTGHAGSYFGTVTSHHQYLMSHNTARQILYGGYSEEQASYRAPIFYDSANTNFYGDFASTGTSLRIAGKMKMDQMAGTVYGIGLSSLSTALTNQSVLSNTGGADTTSDLGVDSAGNVVRTTQEATWNINRTQWNSITTSAGGVTLLSAPGTNKFIIVEKVTFLMKYTYNSSNSFAAPTNQKFEIRQVGGSSDTLAVMSWNHMNSILFGNGSGSGARFGIYEHDTGFSTLNRVYKPNQPVTVNRKTTGNLPSNVNSIFVKMRYRVFDAASF
jgi:hypothetical protein